MDHLTKDEFLALYPQFKNCPDEWFDAIFAQMPCAFSRCAWGCYLQQGEAYYVAHYLTMRELSLQVGGDPNDPNSEVDLLAGVVTSAVTDFQAGSVKYTKDSAVDETLISSPYMRTAYGQAYDALKKQLAVGMVQVT